MQVRKSLGWLAAVIVVLLLAAGAWFGYSAILQQRAELALVTAADFIKASRDHDKLALSEILPPEFADELAEEDYEVIWSFFSTSWEHDSRDIDEDLTDTYVDAGADGEQEVRFELADNSLQTATVDLEWEWSVAGQEGSADEAIELVWLEGAWRVARWESYDLGEELVLHDEDEDPKDLVEAWLELLSPQATSAPEDVVAAYCDAVLVGDYESAFKLLPVDKQESYGDPDVFAEQVKDYDVSGYDIGEVTIDAESGDAVVVVTMHMIGGSFDYVWTLRRCSSGWVAIARELPGLSGSETTAPPLTPEQLSGALPQGSPALSDEQLNSGELPEGHPSIEPSN